MAVLGKRAHSQLRNCFSSAVVESKDKSDSGIIEFSFLTPSCSIFHKGDVNGYMLERVGNSCFIVLHFFYQKSIDFELID